MTKLDATSLALQLAKIESQYLAAKAKAKEERSDTDELLIELHAILTTQYAEARAALTAPPLSLPPVPVPSAGDAPSEQGATDDEPEAQVRDKYAGDAFDDAHAYVHPRKSRVGGARCS